MMDENEKNQVQWSDAPRESRLAIRALPPMMSPADHYAEMVVVDDSLDDSLRDAEGAWMVVAGDYYDSMYRWAERVMLYLRPSSIGVFLVSDSAGKLVKIGSGTNKICNEEAEK